MKILSDLVNLIKVMGEIIKLFLSMEKNVEYLDCIMFITDLYMVFKKYESMLSAQFYTDLNSITPWPKNFFSQISWVQKTLPILNRTIGNEPLLFDAVVMLNNVVQKWQTKLNLPTQ